MDAKFVGVQNFEPLQIWHPFSISIFQKKETMM